MLVTETTSNPVFQMVSTKQDASTITYFFLLILANGAPSPRMVVIDFSKAFFMAVVKALTNCTDTYTYLQILYNIIVLERKENLPSCYARSDVNHFIGMIVRWDCLRDKVRQKFDNFIFEAMATLIK